MAVPCNSWKLVLRLAERLDFEFFLRRGAVLSGEQVPLFRQNELPGWPWARQVPQGLHQAAAARRFILPYFVEEFLKVL